MTTGRPACQHRRMNTIQLTRTTSTSTSHRADHIIAGGSGLLAIALLTVTISLSTIPDLTGSNAEALAEAWLTDQHTADGAVLAVAAGAASYAFMAVFLAGIWHRALDWGGHSVWSATMGISATLFLAGAMVSDAFAWTVPLVRSSNPDLTIPAALLVFADRGWLIALIEAHVALAAFAGATAIAGLLGRAHGHRVPVTIMAVAIVAALSIAPVLLLATSQTVFIMSNQLRLIWLVIMAVWMIARPVAKALPR